MIMYMTDEKFMRAAILEANSAKKIGEVPVGAVAVLDGKVVARAHNIRETKKNPLGHAEIILLEKIVRKKVFPSFRFDKLTVYVTCEPCVMCIGALILSRVKRVVFGCHDKKAGACGSVYDIPGDNRLHHKIEIASGVLGEECGALLSRFFADLRTNPTFTNI